MNNAQIATLIQKHEDPNYDRIRSLVADGHEWDEAEEIDRLERRESVLLKLGARGELNENRRDELDDVQQRLHAVVGNGATFVGTSFSGDGEATGTPTLAADRWPTCPRCSGEGSAEVSHAQGMDTLTCPRCKGSGLLRPVRFDLPFLRTKSVYPLADQRWRVTYEVRCYSPRSEDFWSLRGPVVEERDAIYTALWDAHREAARGFQADAQQHAQRKADRLPHEERLHEEAKRDADRHRSFIEGGGDDCEFYAGIRQ